MKLLNYTTSYFAAILLAVITVWAGLFYWNMLDEIQDSLDDGLENQKLLVIRKAEQDSTVLQQKDFEAGYYRLKEVPLQQAINQKDVYQDTLMYMLNEEDYEPVRMLKTYFRHHDKFYEMRVITSMVEEDDLIEDLFFALLWLYVGLISSILLLNNVLLKKTWQPFYFLLQHLQQFRLENLKLINPVPTRIEEFQQLNITVERLLQSNVNSYLSQKNLIENAAHELQTPLAISLNKLELLVEGNQLTPEQLEQVAGVMDHLERLTRLNKSLLLLSKIENNQFPEVQQVELNATIKQIIADFADQAEYREITITLLEEETCEQNLNADLAHILFLNLMKNAIVHNHRGGIVRITVKSNSIQIQNSGKAVALNPDKVFARFQKDSDSPNSTGLGLAIVKAISDLYRFKINYSYEQFHTWTILF
ncbi:HAMP domain-containing histidine kinase [Adhaeribacter swui]|uniref:histidine kinase n=1 Tax=Adhaeribacter swui TaxID=2086471 RepID=A0A7G7GE08_9BACT|nr:HAMP domain-containing sensor histidine kinase [Adhaeribacter swui]QNF35392.1 HAMP domain-containing histidine kinase [Adhaeribacter swui]